VRPMDLISPALLVISLLVFAQALFTLYLMLYSWEHPDRLRASGGPERLRPSRTTFSVLLPARHEELVIGDTIRRVLKANYPARMVEVIVICSSDDTGTIDVARRTIKALRTTRARVVTFDGAPINKPHALNVGLAASRKDVVTIFDAEDDIDPDVFKIINTVMLDEGVGIVQAGVQLVNHRDHWFSLLNCLEYFFWFKSRLHFHARVGMIPLGGNTVFIRRDLVAKIGGWDQECLTEDADIGIRLSALGERIRVVYDAKHVTREETPGSLSELIRQRTRWHQGFMQVLRKGDWLQLDGFGRKLLAFYTLTFPIIQVPLTLLWPLAVIGGLWLKLPILVAMASFLPLYAVGFQVLVNMVGAWMFAREFGFVMRPWTPLSLLVTFVPYQFALGFASIRAILRELHGIGTWEKTAHVGAHRRDEPSTPRLAWRPLQLATTGSPSAAVVPLSQSMRRVQAIGRRGLSAAAVEGEHVLMRVRRWGVAGKSPLPGWRPMPVLSQPSVGEARIRASRSLHQMREAMDRRLAAVGEQLFALTRRAGTHFAILLVEGGRVVMHGLGTGTRVAKANIGPVVRQTATPPPVPSPQPAPASPARAASPSLGSLIRATIDVPHASPKVPVHVAITACDHGLAATGARFCRRCGATIGSQPSPAMVGQPAPRADSARPRIGVTGHIARALAGVVLALILSFGLPLVGAAPLFGGDPTTFVSDR